MVGSRLWSGLEVGCFFDLKDEVESTGLLSSVDRCVDIYNVHARRRDGIEEIFADIWRNGDFCSIFAVANQARCARD